MIIYLGIIFVLALGITLWSMRSFGKKANKQGKQDVKQGSIILLEDNVQHYR
jgi:hypothetical protein